ncbi:MAG: glycosyltransferase [Saprospiraceae bacterium]|nr:glycosyltransferase [Pyrinomonadaceae bacterium]
MRCTLYICYFGMRQPLVQTQVIPYLLEIAKDGIAISLLTFEPELKEKWTAGQIEIERRKLAEMGIDWHCLPYHKRFSVIATAYDIFRGAWFIRRMIGEKNIDILHGRVHVPTLMGAIARKLSKRKPKLLFDIRGFFPEEYTDAGVWPEGGVLYRSAKRIEKWLMKEADGFVVLTEKAREILFPESKQTGFDKLERPVEVIPCCVDLKRFEIAAGDSRQDMRKKLDIGGRFVMVYVGSFGGWYLTEEMADLYGELKKKRNDAFALVLTQSRPELMETLLLKRGYANSDFLIKQVSPVEIPAYLRSADAAISFIKPCYSKQASSPTKNAEYLGCGLPVIVNDGIGDTTEFTQADQTGVVIEEFANEAYARAMDELFEMMKDRETLAERCIVSARKRFDLEGVGGRRYRRLYNGLSG